MKLDIQNKAKRLKERIENRKREEKRAKMEKQEKDKR